MIWLLWDEAAHKHCPPQYLIWYAWLPSCWGCWLLVGHNWVFPMTFSITELPHRMSHYFPRDSNIQYLGDVGDTHPAAIRFGRKLPTKSSETYCKCTNSSSDLTIYCCSPKYSSINSWSIHLCLRVFPREHNLKQLVLAVVWRADSTLGFGGQEPLPVGGNEDSITRVNY